MVVANTSSHDTKNLLELLLAPRIQGLFSQPSFSARKANVVSSMSHGWYQLGDNILSTKSNFVHRL